MAGVIAGDRSGLAVDGLRPADSDFVFRAFRDWRLDCHGFKDESAWRVMSDLVCSSRSELSSVAVRDGERPVAFLVVIVDPGAFWPDFLARLSFTSLMGKLGSSIAEAARKVVRPPQREGEAFLDEPFDEHFAELTKRGHESREGVAWGLFSFVDPEYRKPPTAFLMYRHMFRHLASRGFHRLEGQIRFGNAQSVGFHRALGYEIKNAGTCYHAVKELTAGGRG